MPKRTDIHSVLLLGAGPIVIGQGCEFDYSGTQACKALREEGYRIVLVNSNPATIMTDPDRTTPRHRAGLDLPPDAPETRWPGDGFAVDESSLPEHLVATHRSLFDGSLQGVERTRCSGRLDSSTANP